LKGVRQNTDEGRCSIWLEEDAKHVLLDCRDTRNWKVKLINDKWLNMNKEVAYGKMLKYTNKD
jgi:HKD family nuclease